MIHNSSKVTTRGHYNMKNCIKDPPIRKVENHCFKVNWSYKNVGSTTQKDPTPLAEDQRIPLLTWDSRVPSPD